MAALDFADVDQRFSIFGIGFRQQFELLEGFVELVVGKQGLSQCVQGVGIGGIHVGGTLVGRNRVFGLL